MMLPGSLVMILTNNRKLMYPRLAMNPLGIIVQQSYCVNPLGTFKNCNYSSHEGLLLRGPGLYDLNLSTSKAWILETMPLGDKGVTSLCEGLKQSSSSLRRLGLGACELTSNCWEALPLVLSCNPHLNSLKLPKNDGQYTGDAEAVLCGAMPCL